MGTVVLELVVTAAIGRDEDDDDEYKNEAFDHSSSFHIVPPGENT